MCEDAVAFAHKGNSQKMTHFLHPGSAGGRVGKVHRFPQSSLHDLPELHLHTREITSVQYVIFKMNPAT